MLLIETFADYDARPPVPPVVTVAVRCDLCDAVGPREPAENADDRFAAARAEGAVNRSGWRRYYDKLRTMSVRRDACPEHDGAPT